MANTNSVAKRARQAEAARQRRVGLNSRFRTSLKKVAKLLQSGDSAGAQLAYQACVPVIDASVSKGLIHKNKAARHKRNLNLALLRSKAAQP